MNYLDQAKKGGEERNSGRLKSRLATTEAQQEETSGSDDFLIDLISAPATSAPAPEPAPAVSETPKTPKASKQPKTETGASKPPKKSKTASADEEADPDKDKYSIYLPKKLSILMRMVYSVTRKKFSHICEKALEDMLLHRYQCENPACTARFSISEGEATPICCPACGGKKFSPLRLDVMEL